MLDEWVGRSQRTTDWITAGRVAAWHATLDRAADSPRDGDEAPLGFHWTLAPAIARESELGPDGHPRRGGFLPPVELPRRLWAGSRVTFHRPLRVGERVERLSEIASITEKPGRESPLVFVTVRHRLSGGDGLAIEEEQDLVYRGAAGAAASRDAGRDETIATWKRIIHPTETLLFRFSALTFNTHRIHYDRRYVMETEGYPGLVVHGPLIATLLTDLLRRERPDARIAAFAFRAVSPLFDIAPFTLRGSPAGDGKTIRLCATNREGGLAMDARATLA